MNRVLEGLGRNFRKTRSDFLEGRIVDRAVCQLAPAFDPAAAKMAIAVENEERPGGRIAHMEMGRRRHQRQNAVCRVERPLRFKERRFSTADL
jgi:hypothetical protein